MELKPNTHLHCAKLTIKPEKYPSEDSKLSTKKATIKAAITWSSSCQKSVKKFAIQSTQRQYWARKSSGSCYKVYRGKTLPGETRMWDNEARRFNCDQSTSMGALTSSWFLFFVCGAPVWQRHVIQLVSKWRSCTFRRAQNPTFFLQSPHTTLGLVSQHFLINNKLKSSALEKEKKQRKGDPMISSTRRKQAETALTGTHYLVFFLREPVT